MSKRRLSSSISPPPTRRQRPKTNDCTSTSTNQQPHAPPAVSVSSPTSRDTKTFSNPDHIHIYSWNVNGITAFLQKPITSFFSSNHTTNKDTQRSSRSPLRDFLRRHHWPQFLCLQEVKIRRGDEGTMRALERAANYDGQVNGGGDSDRDCNSGHGYTASYSLPRDRYNAVGFGGKIYGVATFVRDDCLSGRSVVTKEVEWDLEGRVLMSEVPDCRVVVVNGYWVNGTTNPYRDSRTGVVAGTRHDRKRKFHELMLGDCKDYEDRGWSVVLVGDMNIARSELDGHPGIRLGYDHVVNRAHFNRRFFSDEDGLKAVDAFRHLHGEQRRYTYYGRSSPWGSSCDRVDLAILSRKLVNEERLLAASILNTPEERGHSDHVPLSVIIDLSRRKIAMNDGS